METIHITDKNADMISYNFFHRSLGGDNSHSINKMKRILGQAIQNELTDKQKKCLTLYYYNQMKMKDIAKELGLNISTVSRHISTATKKLKRIAQYYI